MGARNTRLRIETDPTESGVGKNAADEMHKFKAPSDCAYYLASFYPIPQLRFRICAIACKFGWPFAACIIMRLRYGQADDTIR
ncbi:hypothetical protein JYP46_06210 [Nitratireductor aquimarinus]|uniref:hypothetical protein n=1 Tax=Alphaproteobacteria TaxID=28211 RepID=UPI0019D3DD78|nr:MULTISPECIES: hypothetical protein [Alphaproteobacteria]MBN7756406.1 hypothetical protein [Nitratireductor aquimarinus]MBY5999165.1 hypothetical protein [Tritonibacter mobilis]MBY6021192.1 hypothetical protein [Nitratireductor sp. DP7N14-4]